MRAVIIDDEKNAVLSIELALKEYCPDVEVVGKAYSAKEGIAEIHAKKPDLVFLDIQMPHMSGIELLESLGENRKFDVVFVTAFNTYAIKAFKLSAADYLLKPINPAELMSTVKRLQARKLPENTTNEKLQNIKIALEGKLAISTTTGTEFIRIHDIIRLEADGSYSKIITTDGKPRLASKNLKEFQIALAEESFFRTHKSHLINLEYIKKYNPLKDGGTIEMADGSIIDLARTQKVEFAEILTKFSK